MIGKSKVRDEFMKLWQDTFLEGELRNDTFRNALSKNAEGYDPPKEIVDRLCIASPRDIEFWQLSLDLLNLYRLSSAIEPKEARFLSPDALLETQLLQEYRVLKGKTNSLYLDRRTALKTRKEAAYKQDIAFHRWDVAHQIILYEVNVESALMSKVELTALSYAKLKTIYENDLRSSYLPLNFDSSLTFSNSKTEIIDRLYRDFRLFADFPTKNS
ncbi:MAG: hypothetical protein WA919_11080 [Coleofasciculaceae cyanobacterium]